MKQYGKQSIYKGHRERVVDEFRNNRLAGTEDSRALEMLLFYAIPNGDVNPLAHRLMNHFGSLAGVLEASEEDLVKVRSDNLHKEVSAKVDSISPHAALLIQLCLEIGKRYQLSKGSKRDVLQTASDYFNVLRGHFYSARNEMVYMICMDAKDKLLSVNKIAEGTFHAAEIVIRKVVEAVIAVNAVRVVLAHNHVSELAIPSAEDKMTTYHVRDVLEPLGVYLLDHLIIVHDDYVSMAETGEYRL